jgi:hypothetical protein
MENQSLERSPRLLFSKLVLGFYLAHFTVPLLFFVLALWQWDNGSVGKSEKIVLGITSVWLIVGFGALVFSRDRIHFVQQVAKPLLAIYGMYLATGIGEVGVRVLLSHKDQTPGVFTPGSRWVTEADSRILPGVYGTAVFSVNDVGLRGPSFPHQDRMYKIVTVGGSTTECRYLDDSQEWPHLLMQYLNDHQKNAAAWVANAGISGLTTVHHLAFLKRLPILTHSDMLIFLIGANDLTTSLAHEGASTQQMLEDSTTLFFTNPIDNRWQNSELSGLQHLQLFRLGQRVFRHLLRPNEQIVAAEDRPSFVTQCRQRRTASPTVPLPDLHIGLLEYQQRIRALESECGIRKIRCVFLTQPSMWRKDLSPFESSLLWFGWVGPNMEPRSSEHCPARRGYLAVPDAARAIDAYNRTLLSVCDHDGLECYDLASHLPKNTSAFYDDFHFNQSGAEMIAEFVGRHLLDTPPFHAKTY